MDTPASFEWDSAKAEANLSRHGILFEEVIGVFADPFHATIDTTREEDGESRIKVVGQIGERLFSLVLVMRGEVCRVISGRRANASEERTYHGDR